MLTSTLISLLAVTTAALPVTGQSLPSAASGDRPAAAALEITLAEAIRRATENEPNLAAARASQRAASLGRGIARATLLPVVVYHNQVLYTQPNGAANGAGPLGAQPAPIFIANNAVREYASQASINETIGFAQMASVRVADAAALRAAAELEVARRGLVAATSNLYFNLLASERRALVLDHAKDEAASFVSLTEKREAAREVAHADVIKAELTAQQRTRDLADAGIARDRDRLELALLLFADPLTPFTLQPKQSPPPAAFADVEAAAQKENPELAGALAALHGSDAEVAAARSAYLPELALSFNYGLDATTFATKAPFDPTAGRNPRNLGYSIAATLDIPVWDWLATERRVKQGEARRDAVRVALTAAQKRLIVDLKEGYAEAQGAHDQLASLELSARTADESLRLTRLRYSDGESTALEVVDAQAAFSAAELAQADGAIRYEQALSNLATLTGQR